MPARPPTPLLALLALLLWAGTASAEGVPYPWQVLGRDEGLPSDDVLDICSSGPDTLWAATAAGLCRIRSHSIELLGPGQGLPAGAPLQVEPAGAKACLALYSNALARVDERGVRLLRLPYDPARTGAVTLATLNGQPWITVDARGAGFLWDDGKWKPGTARDPAPQSRAPPELGSLPVGACVTHAGRMWCATRGLGILHASPRAFRKIDVPGVDEIVSLAAAPDGSIWCGTNDGIAHVRPQGVRRITHVSGKKLGLVTGCAVDRDGRLWLGSGSSWTGLYRLDQDTWQHFGKTEGFVDAYVHGISKDSAGTLWFSTLNAPGGDRQDGEGVWFYDEGQIQPLKANKDLPSGRVYDVLARDRTGVLWCATLNGLAAYERGEARTYGPEDGLAGEKVWCLCPARGGGVWIGYQLGNHGVSLLNREGVRGFNVADGLVDGNVWSIVETEPGVLWFATGGGLGRYDGLRWSSFRAHQGLGADRLWPLLPAEGGRLWIGTIGGGLVELTVRDRERPRTRFDAESFEFGPGVEAQVTWRGTDAWFDTPSDDLWYRTKLDDEPWSRASPATKLQLRLEPGRYRLQVQALDRFGNAETPPAEVEIVVAGERRPLVDVLPWVLAAAIGLLLVFRLRRS